MDTVSFKFYLRSNSLDEKNKTVKEEDLDEVRRCNVDKDVASSFTYMQEKLCTIFPRLRRELFTLSWTDSDGDAVTVSSDDELAIAMAEMTGPLYKFNVFVKGEKKGGFAHENKTEGAVHTGVMCDGCDKDVVGYRYKCAVCPDYDLCGTCEAKGTHSEHNMLRIASPDDAFPHHFYRRLNKMHERIHKRAEKAARKDHEDQHSQNVFYQDAFDPFLNGGNWVHGMGRGGGGGGCGRGRGRGYFGGPGGRQNLWGSMMNGWRGEEPNHCRSSTTSKTETKTSTENSGANEAKHQEQNKNSPPPYVDPLTDFLNSLNLGGANGGDYLKNVGQMVAAALDPLGVDVKIDVEHNGKTTNIKESDKKKEEEEVVVVTKEKKDEDEEEKKSEEATSENLKKDEVLAEKETNAASSSDEDEWTVLNKTGDSKTIEIPINTINVEEEPKGEPSKNVDVPITVSNQPAKVLFGTPEGTLYPELPKEDSSKTVPIEQENKDSGKIEIPVTVVNSEEKPSAPVMASHPNPRIQVALQAMLNMGFTNEGEWLTRLLEAKDGDIGRTLDILQPVRPTVRK